MFLKSWFSSRISFFVVVFVGFVGWLCRCCGFVGFERVLSSGHFTPVHYSVFWHGILPNAKSTVFVGGVFGVCSASFWAYTGGSF